MKHIFVNNVQHLFFYFKNVDFNANHYICKPL